MNNNKINSICKSLNLTFQKQNKSEKDIDEIQQFLANTNFMKDLSHPLLIIKTQNMSILVLEAIRELEDNAYPLLKEQYSKLSIKTFNISHQDSLNSYLCQTIKLLCQNITQFQLQQNICDLLKMVEEIYILQQNEQIANSLIFQCVQNEFQNEIFQTILLYNLYSQQVLNKNQKYLFINISGLNTIEQDFKFMKQVNLLKKSNKNMDVYYLSFHKKELQAKQNKRFSSNQLFEQYFLEIQQDHQITWPQLKSYFKPIIKRKIQLFNPQVCVLQLFISLDKVEDKDGLKLEIECIFKIIHYFQKISKDKLLINLLIKDSESNVQMSIELTNIFKQEQDFQIAKKVQLKQIINAIEQGIFGKIKVEIVDKRSYDQILIDFKCQLNQIQNQKYSSDQIFFFCNILRRNNNYKIQHQFNFLKYKRIQKYLTKLIDMSYIKKNCKDLLIIQFVNKKFNLKIVLKQRIQNFIIIRIIITIIHTLYQQQQIFTIFLILFQLKQNLNKQFYLSFLEVERISCDNILSLRIQALLLQNRMQLCQKGLPFAQFIVILKFQQYKK